MAADELKKITTDNIPFYAGPVTGENLPAIGADGRCGGCTASVALCRCVRVEG